MTSKHKSKPKEYIFTDENPVFEIDEGSLVKKKPERISYMTLCLENVSGTLKANK